MNIVICCEVDHDVLGYGVPATRFDVYKEKLGWKGVDNIPKVKEICNSVEDGESDGAKITWLVRSDEQLKVVFDDYAYPLKEFWNLWEELKKQGDEIGWHPHLWRWSNESKCWYQEVSDKTWISRCLENGHKEFLKVTDDLTVIRMGWGFHNNFTMRKINDLGLKVDITASPGLRYLGGPDERGSHFVNEYDWSITAEAPYHPFKDDYRRPARGNEQSLSVLEIPLTTQAKSLRKVFLEEMAVFAPLIVKRRLIKGWGLQDSQVQHRYIAEVTAASFRVLAEKRFREAKRNRQVNTSLVARFHPIELFKPKGFSILQNNLEALRDMSKRFAVPFRFLTATQMAKELTEVSTTSKKRSTRVQL